MGIDYGNGKTNFDVKNGIRFGIIPADEVGQFWYDESEPQYGEPACPVCDGEVTDYDDNEHDEYEPYNNYGVSEYTCVNCETIFSTEDVYPENPDCFTYDDDGYQLQQNQDASDIWVLKSPFYTVAGFCSPCAPGAVYLTDPSPDAKAYCLGSDWFESGKAPYKVFSVETGKEVLS